MSRYVRLGELPRRRHTQFRRPDGGLYAEQVFSTRGFSGPMSTLYHRNLPTEVSKWEDMGSIAPAYIEDEPLRHRHLRTKSLKPCGDAVSGRIPLMGNQDVIWHQACVAEQMSTFYKNADGDECLFMHDGEGTLESLFGSVEFIAGDYLVIPRGTIYKLTFKKLPARLLALISFGPIEVPRRYRNEYGQMLEHAPYSERDLRPPSVLPVHDEPGEHQILIRARNRLTLYTHPYHPLDVVGWDGYVFLTRSTSTTSRRSPASSTCRRRSTRPLPATTSWCARSAHACSTTIPTRSRCLTTTPTSIRTRSCTT